MEPAPVLVLKYRNSKIRLKYGLKAEKNRNN
jgi:hypothetical protein